MEFNNLEIGYLIAANLSGMVLGWFFLKDFNDIHAEKSRWPPYHTFILFGLIVKQDLIDIFFFEST